MKMYPKNTILHRSFNLNGELNASQADDYGLQRGREAAPPWFSGCNSGDLGSIDIWDAGGLKTDWILYDEAFLCADQARLGVPRERLPHPRR